MPAPVQHPAAEYTAADQTDEKAIASLAPVAAVGQEGFYPYGGSFLDTKTPDNFEARLTILPLGRYGVGTQVRVCIGGFGTHRKVCARILDEIARHLDAARRSPPAPGVVVLPAVGGMAGPPPLIIVRPGSTAPPAPPPPPTPVK
ncbi:MAG TPA: hypothetical protein VKE94_14975 [Gemmataceae bacterium]|nr:hypothetical protein [Gemmataceae bacterium]